MLVTSEFETARLSVVLALPGRSLGRCPTEHTSSGQLASRNWWAQPSEPSSASRWSKLFPPFHRSGRTILRNERLAASGTQKIAAI